MRDRSESLKSFIGNLRPGKIGTLQAKGKAFVLKRSAKRVLRGLGYEIHKIEAPPPILRNKNKRRMADPGAMTPVWPLPRRLEEHSDEEIRAQFARYDRWHYAYEFEGGLSLSAPHRDRPLQRFRHFMPYLLESQNGTLKGKRVLDIACNSGFWSLQCALLGAEVVGIDARSELVEQANLVKSITGINNAEFKVLDFWQMSPQELGGQFDVVLNLGILYHLPDPLAALELTKSMSRKTILLDTAVLKSELPLIQLLWEEPLEIRLAVREGVVARPSRSATELMLSHLKFRDWFEIPLRTRDMPKDYLNGYRATWLLEV